MARQLGHVNYGGTIGGIRHFKIKGLSGNFAGLKGGAVYPFRYSHLLPLN